MESIGSMPLPIILVHNLLDNSIAAQVKDLYRLFGFVGQFLFLIVSP